MPNVTLFVCGDVMTGRGIDQVLPHPENPRLYEPYLHDARDYVRLAEEINGPIPHRADVAYPWGDALDMLLSARTDVRLINLETSITTSPAAWPGKEVHYRMHPGNIGCLTAARLDCCCLANNHVLDWGYPGLDETLQTLDIAGIAHPGAGRNALEAASPAVLTLPGKGRLLVFALGSTTSGIPGDWAATADRAGVNLLRDLSSETARSITAALRPFKQPGDVAVASIHWGANWEFRVPPEQIDFAHRLVEGGFDLVHGHSSHHLKPIEVYRDRLILYGCGDFLDDYEGIRGYEEFSPELRLGYLVKLDPQDGRLLDLLLEPITIRQFRLQRASEAEADWTCQLLNELSGPFDTRVLRATDGRLSVHRK
ncbi:MAG TPA: CapA family protein [Stenomitos sp.]